MILRLWSGWTAPGGDTEAYDELLDATVAPGIVGRRLRGLDRFEVWTRRADERKEGEELEEFLTAMWFRDLDAVRAFTGGDHRESVVPPAAREVLSRYDDRSRHYELRRRHWPEA